MGGGQYLKHIDKSHGSENKGWKRTKYPVLDFATFVRNFTWYKLTHFAGFKYRNFMSYDGKYIFSILYVHQ
jgi:hypothetical protein